MIETHYSKDCNPPWLAVDMHAAIACLEGYALTAEERTELPYLMAGYCRLIDEAGLCFYGETEAEAVALANDQDQRMRRDVPPPTPSTKKDL